MNTRSALHVRAFLGLFGLAHEWTATGPTPEAAALRDGPEPTRDQVVMRAAFDLWDGSGKLTIAELLEHGQGIAAPLGSLVTALHAGPAGMKAWLAGVSRIPAHARRGGT